MAKVINIKWETDGYEIDLPNEVTIPDCFMDSDAGPDVDAISDWLSDMSGWLHDGFEDCRIMENGGNTIWERFHGCEPNERHNEKILPLVIFIKF